MPQFDAVVIGTGQAGPPLARRLVAEGRKVDWMYEPTYRPRWFPGFPERLMFATLTCAPWSWVLVAPCEQAPLGFINVQTGEAHPVVW